MSITTETISQHTMCENSEDSYTEANKEQIKCEQKLKQLLKTQEIYFKYFLITEDVENKSNCQKVSYDGAAIGYLAKREDLPKPKG